MIHKVSETTFLIRRKYEKLTLLDALKIHFQRFFALMIDKFSIIFALSYLHLVSNGLHEVNINSLV